MLVDPLPLALTFDDVLLVPRHSEVLPPRADVSTRLGRGERAVALGCPVLSAAMDTVTEAGLAIALGQGGGLGVLHKNVDIATQASWVERVVAHGLPSAAAVGVGGDSADRVKALVEAGVRVIVLDTAHGHSQGVLDRAKAVKDAYPHLTLVVGNLATPEAVLAAAEAGADVVKVGVGPGSICTTRIVAGVGVPQLTAVATCSAAAREVGVSVIADGGIRSSGDVAKALAAGADAVMLGGMFAGTDEAPGEVVTLDGRPCKTYRGMGSVRAMKAGSSDRYFQADQRKLVPEGVVAAVPCKGPVSDVLFQLLGGLRASMGYCGCPDIPTLQRDARFVRITNAGLSESHVHDVRVTERAPNYDV
ncbi:MAG: IMP dehydrogenase [Alphaproteobacteria bacterium]|nr:IMP dehydrogenase [Alphaproteobacteria bacterium]